jgi:SAM-dependent methyltransferase
VEFFNAIRLARRIVGGAVRLESWYFDKKHNVETNAGEGEEQAHSADLRAGFWYLPTRPGTVRLLLNELPVANYSNYTFVDLGSGKGRVLLIAARYCFQKVVGVELRKDLHERAVRNVRSCRGLKNKCGGIECVNLNALDYEFPDENLVLYFFNPFGNEIMQALLNRLTASLDRCPRDVFLAMVYPEHVSAVDAMPRWSVYKQLRRCRIYRIR